MDPALLQVQVPTFTLQPLLENAIKHGIAEMLSPGTARIRARLEAGALRLDVEDTAGAYGERERSKDGLGLQIVEKRIQGLLGPGHRLEVFCQPNQLTRFTLRLPLERLPPAGHGVP